MPARASSLPADRASWTISGAIAAVQAAATEARLDLAAPTRGLVIAAAEGPDHLLGIDLHAVTTSADHWVRGGDLTVVYEPGDVRGLRATAMWRVLHAAEAAWELVVSAQTSLLHAEAALSVVSEMAGGDVRWTADAAAPTRWTPLDPSRPLPPEAMAVLVRRSKTAVVVAVHPQDPRRITVTGATGRTRVECSIFPAAIEKGVILRSRVLAAIGAAHSADTWAGDMCAAFAASPPFLDT